MYIYAYLNGLCELLIQSGIESLVVIELLVITMHELLPKSINTKVKQKKPNIYNGLLGTSL